jgi:hypothetical protein
MKNIQFIDTADNATYSIFQVTDEEFALIFPGHGQDLEMPEVAFKRLGQKQATDLFAAMWQRPILKSQVQGIHGTLFQDYFPKRRHFPTSKREIDRADVQLNTAQRALYRAARSAPTPRRQ